MRYPDTHIKPPSYCISFLLTLLFSLSCSGVIFAQVVINEFDAVANPQAVELLNTSDQAIDINSWYLDDSTGSTYLTLTNQPLLQPQTCIVIRGTLNLNTASPDTVRLFDSTAPPTSATAHLIDSYAYAQSPSAGSTYSRNPDGSGSFGVLLSSLGLFNGSRSDCTTSQVTPTISNTPSPTPTHTPSPVLTPTSTWTPTPTSLPSPSTTPSTTPSTPSPSPTKTPSPAPQMYISEVMVNPSTGYEWVELYNNTANPYTLIDWYIDDLIDGGSSPVRIGITVPAFGYSVIEIPSPIFNNAGDSIRLIDHEGREVEIFMFTNSKVDISWGRTSVYEDILCEQTPSKGIANNLCLATKADSTSTPTPSPSPSPLPTSTIIPDTIYLSELYVNPNAGEHEWLEVYNDNRYSVTLSDWKVRDAANQIIATIHVSIDPYRYALIELTSDKMNNSNEEILLLNPSGEVADRFTYENSEKGLSWGRSPAYFSEWCLQDPSPNRYNYSCISQPTSTHTPTPSPSRSPTPTRSKTPTPTTRISISTQSSSGPNADQSASVLGIATTRASGGTNTEILNYTPQNSSLKGAKLGAGSDSLIEQSTPKPSGNLLSVILYLFLLSLCMMMGGFQASKLWNLYRESNPIYPDMFG